MDYLILRKLVNNDQRCNKYMSYFYFPSSLHSTTTTVKATSSVSDLPVWPVLQPVPYCHCCSLGTTGKTFQRKAGQCKGDRTWHFVSLMHLSVSGTLQLSCRSWEQPFSFMGELYFPAALQRRPEQNTDPKMEKKVCSPLPFWPHIFRTHVVADNFQYRPVTIHIFSIGHFLDVLEGVLSFWAFAT